MSCCSNQRSEGHHVSLGKPEAYTAEAPSEVCPVVRLNLRVLRVRDGGEGLRSEMGGTKSFARR